MNNEGDLQSNDRGMTGIEFALVFAGFMPILMLILQGILLFNAHHAAALGAARGVDVVQAAEGSAGAGSAIATSTASQLAAFSSGPSASVTNGAEQVSVRVTGNVPALFPGAPTAVEAVEFGPKERQPDPP